MLVISRGTQESIVIGNDIRVKVLKVRGDSVYLGIEYPDGATVLRGEFGYASVADAGPIPQGLPIRSEQQTRQRIEELRNEIARLESLLDNSQSAIP